MLELFNVAKAALWIPSIPPPPFTELLIVELLTHTYYQPSTEPRLCSQPCSKAFYVKLTGYNRSWKASRAGMHAGLTPLKEKVYVSVLIK